MGECVGEARADVERGVGCEKVQGEVRGEYGGVEEVCWGVGVGKGRCGERCGEVGRTVESRVR